MEFTIENVGLFCVYLALAIMAYITLSILKVLKDAEILITDDSIDMCPPGLRPPKLVRQSNLPDAPEKRVSATFEENYNKSDNPINIDEWLKVDDMLNSPIKNRAISRNKSF